jgi:hypothetical protein
MKTLGALFLAAALSAAIGCGSTEGGDYTVGTVGPGGEETTLSHDDALDYIFDNEEIPASMVEEVCDSIESRGEDDTRHQFIKVTDEWINDSFDFSPAEIFDEAASRC